MWVWVAGLALSIALPPTLYWREILQWLAGRFLNMKPQSDDPGYEVLTWWDEPEDVFDEIKASLSLRKRFPRAIRDKRTGEVHEVPHPRK